MAVEIIQGEAEFRVVLADHIFLPLPFPGQQAAHIFALIPFDGHSTKRFRIHLRFQHRFAVPQHIVAGDIREHRGEQLQGEIHVLFVRVHRNAVFREIKGDGRGRIVKPDFGIIRPGARRILDADQRRVRRGRHLEPRPVRGLDLPGGRIDQDLRAVGVGNLPDRAVLRGRYRQPRLIHEVDIVLQAVTGHMRRRKVKAQIHAADLFLA